MYVFLKFIEIIEIISNKKNKADFAVLINPEFLREGSSINDFINPPYILIGTEPKNELAVKMLSNLYSNIPAEIIITTVKIAEFVKLVHNSFHALKISYANEIGNICKALNLDSQRVMDLLIQDKVLNISSQYLKPGFAFGGSCLPKDLRFEK